MNHTQDEIGDAKHVKSFIILRRKKSLYRENQIVPNLNVRSLMISRREKIPSVGKSNSTRSKCQTVCDFKELGQA